MSVVPLDDFFTRELPVKLPELRRKAIIRVRGLILNVRSKGEFTLAEMQGYEKPLAAKGCMPSPNIGSYIEAIVTEGVAYAFLKYHKEIPECDYELRSSQTLEDIALEILAGSPDERITPDSLHTPEFMEAAVKLGIPDAMETTDAQGNPVAPKNRFVGAVIGTLLKKQIITCVGRTRSIRPECHFRRGQGIYTWRMLQCLGQLAECLPRYDPKQNAWRCEIHRSTWIQKSGWGT